MSMTAETRIELNLFSYMNRNSTEILSSPIEYLKGVGPQRAILLRKELGIDTFRDLLELYPYRHLDKSQITSISRYFFCHRICSGGRISRFTSDFRHGKIKKARFYDKGCDGCSAIGLVSGNILDGEKSKSRIQVPGLWTGWFF